MAARTSLEIGERSGGGIRRNFLGPALAEMRVNRGITQATICKKLQLRGWDISRQVLRFIEEGSRILSDIELLALLDALGVTPGELEGEFRRFRSRRRRR